MVVTHPPLSDVYARTRHARAYARRHTSDNGRSVTTITTPAKPPFLVRAGIAAERAGAAHFLTFDQRRKEKGYHARSAERDVAGS
jgi:hypothetical protein